MIMWGVLFIYILVYMMREGSNVSCITRSGFERSPFFKNPCLRGRSILVLSEMDICNPIHVSYRFLCMNVIKVDHDPEVKVLLFSFSSDGEV